MKKWAGVLMVIALLTGWITYVWKKDPVAIKSTKVMFANRAAIARLLIRDNNWDKWWPGGALGDRVINDSSFDNNGYRYTITGREFNIVPIKISKGDRLVANTTLIIVDTTHDYVRMEWVGVVRNSINPIINLSSKSEAKTLEKNMDSMLGRMQSFFEDSTRVYGRNIFRDRLVDSLLVFTYDTSRGYPSVNYIYNLLDKLKAHILKHGAKITGYPMLNVHTSDSIFYQTKVAIPTDRKLPDEGPIVYRWMMSGAYILVTDVKGDELQVTKAFRDVDNFARDHHLIPPVIPFYSLITDRRLEKDSTKWMTRIIYPIMD